MSRQRKTIIRCVVDKDGRVALQLPSRILRGPKPKFSYLEVTFTEVKNDGETPSIWHVKGRPSQKSCMAQILSDEALDSIMTDEYRRPLQRILCAWYHSIDDVIIGADQLVFTIDGADDHHRGENLTSFLHYLQPSDGTLTVVVGEVPEKILKGMMYGQEGENYTVIISHEPVTIADPSASSA